MSNYQQADAVILAFLRGEPQPRTRAWLRPTQGFECLELRYSAPDPASGLVGPCHVIVAELRNGRLHVLLPTAYPAAISPRRALAIHNRILGAARVLGTPYASATFEELNGD